MLTSISNAIQILADTIIQLSNVSNEQDVNINLNTKIISYPHRDWALDGLENVSVGQEVEFIYMKKDSRGWYTSVGQRKRRGIVHLVDVNNRQTLIIEEGLDHPKRFNWDGACNVYILRSRDELRKIYNR